MTPPDLTPLRDAVKAEVPKDQHMYVDLTFDGVAFAFEALARIVAAQERIARIGS